MLNFYFFSLLTVDYGVHLRVFYCFVFLLALCWLHQLCMSGNKDRGEVQLQAGVYFRKFFSGDWSIFRK